MFAKWVLLFTIQLRISVGIFGYELILNSNSPVTTGSTVTLNATVIDSRGVCATGDLIFCYEDDAFPRHTFTVHTKYCEVIFQIPFDTTIGASVYRYQVDVKQKLMPFIDHPIASGRGQLTITENLNGLLQLFQNKTNISKNSAQTIYVPSNLEIEHKIELNTADFDYLNKSANSVTIYWFIDCVYLGNTTSYTFSTNYTKPDIEHEVLGIVVADIGPPITTTTVSPTDTTTSSPPTSTSLTSIAPSTPSINPTTETTINTTTTETPLKIDITGNVINSSITSECQEKKPFDLLFSTIRLENLQKYGYFSRSILIKDPVENVKTQGKVWIQEGEMLDLQVSCNGSGPFRYCAHYVKGPYNITGNETCLWERNLIQCQMQFFHYFHEPTNYTLVVIMANDVSKVVTPIGINIYKVQKQPQISVIVVPVTFSSIAVIIVVFGIAYYFQNRSRYMVEVADFDFANNSDMEYKTFRERLRDAISQAINRTQDYSEYDGSEEHIGSLVAPQNQKYGSMQ